MNNQLAGTCDVYKIYKNTKEGDGIYVTDRGVIVVYNNGYSTDHIIDYGDDSVTANCVRWAADNNWLGEYRATITKAVELNRAINETDKTLLDYDNNSYPLISEPMPHHERGLCYTASGYGAKIPTAYKVIYKNRLYRLYTAIYSNIGTTYIIAAGTKIILR